jgi:hypothetical protein
MPDHDQLCAMFGSQGGDGSRVERARDVVEHAQGIGDRAGRVAQGDTQVLFSGINGEDAH